MPEAAAAAVPHQDQQRKAAATEAITQSASTDQQIQVAVEVEAAAH
jgi:hypothetical protein